jgi:phospholipid transport system substrate-binding protein
VNLRIRRSAIALVAVTLLATPGSAAEPAEAQAVVEETVDQVLEVLAKEGLDDERRRRQIEEIAYARFDFAVISRLVLGSKSWKRFSPEQQQEFIEQFKIQLSRRYGSRLMRYDQQQVKILGHRVGKQGHVTVRTRIEGGSADGIEIDYRLRTRDGKKGGPWLVIDVSIEGVSLARSYHEQFKDMLGRGSPEDLLKQLREKNAEEPA